MGAGEDTAPKADAPPRTFQIQPSFAAAGCHRDFWDGALGELLHTERHHGADAGGEGFDPGDRRAHVTFDAFVGQEHDRCLPLLPWLALKGGFDRDVFVGKDAGDVGQDSWLVRDSQAQVVAGRDLVDRQHGDVAHTVRLERQVRHAVLGVGGDQPRDVDQVRTFGFISKIKLCT